MAKETKIAAFEGGALRILASAGSGREAVLALPLSRLIAKVVRVPSGEVSSRTVASARAKTRNEAGARSGSDASERT